MANADPEKVGIWLKKVEGITADQIAGGAVPECLNTLGNLYRLFLGGCKNVLNDLNVSDPRGTKEATLKRAADHHNKVRIRHIPTGNDVWNGSLLKDVKRALTSSEAKNWLENNHVSDWGVEKRLVIQAQRIDSNIAKLHISHATKKPGRTGLSVVQSHHL
jgi:hypothetical protein